LLYKVPPTSKRMVWRVTEAASLKDGADAFVLFLRGAQLALRSSVLTVLDFDEVDVTSENAEIFGSAPVLSGKVEKRKINADGVNTTGMD